MDGQLSVTAGDFVSERHGRIRDTYRIGSKVGDGAFGSVRKITHRVTGEVRAVKTIHKKSLRTEEERQTFFNEVAVLRALDHPNILKLYEFYQDDKNYYLITEFCSGGELFDRIINRGYFSEAVAAEYMRQILSVVCYCHDRGVVHRDLKPENFLLDSPSEDANLKVIDFGTARFFNQGEFMTQKFGTPYYIAPEVLRRSYDEKCDIWSAGVNMYILLCGYPPFGGHSDEQILKRVAAGRFAFPSPEWDNISREAKDLISKMLSPASTRISAHEALQHPWILNASRAPIDHSMSASILKNLQGFHAERRLQKATLTFIASHLATKSEREEMKEIFKSLDTDNNGTLSREELIQGFSQLFGDTYGEDIEEEVTKIMDEVDINHSGAIDYTEFIIATMNRQSLLSRDRLEEAFRTFDKDGSGSITAEELKEVLGKHQKYDDAVWHEIIKEVDQNGDGVIDLKEFIDMMTRHRD